MAKRLITGGDTRGGSENRGAALIFMRKPRESLPLAGTLPNKQGEADAVRAKGRSESDLGAVRVSPRRVGSKNQRNLQVK